MRQSIPSKRETWINCWTVVFEFSYPSPLLIPEQGPTCASPNIGNMVPVRLLKIAEVPYNTIPNVTPYNLPETAIQFTTCPSSLLCFVNHQIYKHHIFFPKNSHKANLNDMAPRLSASKLGLIHDIIGSQFFITS